MIDHPIYADGLEDKSGAGDPLGLNAINQWLVGLVFPGVNNVVRYIRVYSALCWVAKLVEQHLETHGAGLTAKEAHQRFELAMQKMELLLIWANQGRGQRQLAGVRRSFEHAKAGITLEFANVPGSNASLRDAVAYRPSLTDGLGFVEVRDQGIWACTEAGLTLANAYEQWARRVGPKYSWLANIEARWARRSDLVKLDKALTVAAPSAAEQRAFLAQFFPHDTTPLERSGTSYRRNQALHLLLRSVSAVHTSSRGARENDGGEEESALWNIRKCMARGRAYKGSSVKLKAVEAAQGRWALLQLRQVQRLALELLFACVEQWLDTSQGNEAPISIDACVATLAQVGQAALPGKMRTRVGAQLAQLKHWQGEWPTLYGAAANGEEEADLFAAWDRLEQSDVSNESGLSHALAECYFALIFCSAEVSNLRLVNPDVERLLKDDGGSCSLLALEASTHHSSSLAPKELFAHWLKRWVILRHFDVATRRTLMQGDGCNRFRLMVGERGIQRVEPFSSTLDPGSTPDRIENVVALCCQGGLIAWDGTLYTLTEAGVQRMREGFHEY